MSGNSGLWKAASGGAILALALAAGCAKKEAVTPTPEAGWVRLDPLVARHPLMTEVERLRRVEQTFERQTVNAGSGGESIVLPALPALGPVRENANLAQRRQAQRRQVRQAVEQGLRNYAEGRELRRQRVYEQRRTELAAALRARDADAERLARLVLEQETAQRLSGLAKERLEIEVRMAVLEGQIQQESLTPGPTLKEDLDAEINRLKANPAVEGISPRARLTLRLQREQALLATVIAQIQAATREGRARVAALAADADRLRNEEIAATLRKLQQGDVLASIGADQRVALQNVLAAETRSARLEKQVMQTAASGVRSGAAALALGRLGSEDGTGPGLQAAATRIRRQRQNLERFIVETVAEAVRDTAHEQNVTVTLVQGKATAKPARPGRDMTEDFMRSIRWGQPLPHSGKTPSGRTAPQANVRRGGKDMRS